MGATMEPVLGLNGSERELLIELLEREKSELPAEIRHTDSPDMHDRLRERLIQVQSLLSRLQALG